MAILSIQSHVAYGYVGNKAAVYPLQSIGYDVWSVNTVQFSSHTGYKEYRGEIFSAEHIRNVIKGIEAIGVIDQCQAILSGYMGSKDICLEVYETVARFKSKNDKIIYLCDPVIGNTNCFVKPEVLDFFKTRLKADIITPNQFEAETLSNIKIVDKKTLLSATEYFHNLGINVVVITGIKNTNINNNKLTTFISDNKIRCIVSNPEHRSFTPINGTGDLFSAIFLGTYLSTKNVVESLKNAVYYLNKVTRNTIKIKARELQVISTRYNLNPKKIEALLL